MIRLSNLFILWALFIAPCAYSQTQCGDFLSQLGQKPQNLAFISCEQTKDAQIKVFEASYQVAGIHAKQIEQHFIETAHMPPLRFVCCGWETSNQQGNYRGYYPNPEQPEFAYEIRMTSGETLEKDWNKIPFFYITVVLPLERP